MGFLRTFKILVLSFFLIGARQMRLDLIEMNLKELSDWNLSKESDALEKSYQFGNWEETMKFVTQVSEIAESQNHHPDICFGWGWCQIKIQTHDQKGLTELDFQLAKSIDEIL